MKTIKSNIIILILLLPLLSFTQKVENIRYELAGKEIHIYYDLLGYQVYSVRVGYSNNQGQTWGKPLKYVRGDVGLGQIPGKNKMIIWDISKEKVNSIGEMSFKVVPSIQSYRGTIPPPPDDDANSVCEFTTDMLIDKEYLDEDEHGTFQDNKIFYGIVTEFREYGNGPAGISYFIVKIGERGMGGYIEDRTIRSDINILGEKCQNKKTKIIVPGRRLKFSIASAGCPGCGNMSSYFPLTYLKILDENSFLSETEGYYSQNYNENITKWQMQTKNITLADSVLSSIDFLKEMNGEYPSNIGLFDNIIIQERLKKLLGNNYLFFKGSFTVQFPIEINNQFFVTEGFQKHYALNTFIFVFDLSKNVIYVGIGDDGEVETYSENDSTPPEVLLKWVDRH